MIKILGMVLIMVSTTAMGFMYSNKLKERLNNICDIEKIIVMLRGEIKYKSTVLEEAFDNIGKRCEKSFVPFISAIAENMRDEQTGTMKELAELHKDKLKETNLKDEDIEKLSEFVGNLGYLDKEMQLSQIELYLEELKSCKSDSYEEIKRNGKLYKYMGIMSGIMICIFIA